MALVRDSYEFSDVVNPFDKLQQGFKGATNTFTNIQKFKDDEEDRNDRRLQHEIANAFSNKQLDHTMKRDSLAHQLGLQRSAENARANRVRETQAGLNYRQGIREHNDNLKYKKLGTRDNAYNKALDNYLTLPKDLLDGTSLPPLKDDDNSSLEIKPKTDFKLLNNYFDTSTSTANPISNPNYRLTPNPIDNLTNSPMDNLTNSLMDSPTDSPTDSPIDTILSDLNHKSNILKNNENSDEMLSNARFLVQNTGISRKEAKKLLEDTNGYKHFDKEFGYETTLQKRSREARAFKIAENNSFTDDENRKKDLHKILLAEKKKVLKDKEDKKMKEKQGLGVPTNSKYHKFNLDNYASNISGDDKTKIETRYNSMFLTGSDYNGALSKLQLLTNLPSKEIHKIGMSIDIGALNKQFNVETLTKYINSAGLAFSENVAESLLGSFVKDDKSKDSKAKKLAKVIMDSGVIIRKDKKGVPHLVREKKRVISSPWNKGKNKSIPKNSNSGSDTSSQNGNTPPVDKGIGKTIDEYGNTVYNYINSSGQSKTFTFPE